MKKGFTLIELLAVIVILAIILAIAVPSISNMIENSKISSFESDTKMILNAIKLKTLEDSSFDPTTVNISNITLLLKINSDNYSYLKVFKQGEDFFLISVGKNKWENYAAHGTYSTISVDKNLVLWLDAGITSSYSGTGTLWYDLSGNNNNGTLAGSISYNSLNGGSFVFNGVNTYAIVPDNDILTMSNGIGTWEVWVKPTGNSEDENGIMIKANYSLGQREFQFNVRYLSSANIYYAFFNENNNNNWTNWNPIGSETTSAISINQWHHILATTDGKGNGYLYVDGLLKSSSSSLWTTIANSSAPLIIGGGIDNTVITQMFVGNIAMCKLYNSFTTGDEVVKKFNEQRNRFGL
jgi:prepilin-type N-terminal cleavage/methylation domain-containing protein